MSTEENGSFRPGTYRQWAWDSTSLNALKTCPQKYKYSIIDGWITREGKIDLFFGQLFHSAMEHYAKALAAGSNHDTALRLVLAEAWLGSWPWPYEHKLKTRENLLRGILWCLEDYADDSAKTVILANGRPAVELSFQFDIGNGYTLCGHLDRIIEFAGETFITDYKTTTTTPGSYFFDRYNPDNQMSLYSLGGQVIWNLPIKGVMIYAVQIAVGFTRTERGMTYRNPAQLDEWLTDTREWIARAEDYADRKVWPRNDTACNMYGGCQFRGVCSKDPAVRQAFLETAFEKRIWDPSVSR